MHALVVLTAVLSSLAPAVDAPLSARHDGGPSLMQPDSRRGHDLHLLDADLDTSIHDGSGEESAAGRIVVESLVGFGAGVVGFSLPALGHLLAPKAMEFWTMAAFSSVLHVLGTSLGVSLTGNAMDGRGRSGYAFLGSLVGFVVPLAIGTAMMLRDNCRSASRCTALVPTVVGMLVLPTVGATLGYELSAPKPWLSEGSVSRAPRAAPRVVPVLVLATEGVGGTLGLAGRF